MKIRLIAHNNQGASVEFLGDTKKEALANFLFVYERKGWEINYFTYVTDENIDWSDY